MYEQAVDLLAKTDTFAVIEFLDQQEDQICVAETYSDLVKHLYWHEKKVPDLVALARAGIQYSLAAGSNTARKDIIMANDLRSAAKMMAYNLESFTWIGWDEPGINLNRTDQCYGLEAARTNLRLAFELDKGDLRISRAYWMEGAQLLAASDMARSRASFQRAATYAARAGAQADELLSRAFELLLDLLQDPQKVETQDSLLDLKRQLVQVENGRTFISQLDTAWRVFNHNC